MVFGGSDGESLSNVDAAWLMFWVPQSARLGLGVSILSYAGQVRLGVASDAGLVPDPEAIISQFQVEMTDILQSC